MKKILVVLLSMALTIGALTACGNASAAAKTGLAVVSSTSSSKSAIEEDGFAQVDSLVVAVLIAEDGKILDCKIDQAQTKINFSNIGMIKTNLATEIKSKQELGADYGMTVASKIGKEWNEQADAFAAYVIGKTLDEVTGIAVNEEGLAADTDLISSVTVHIGDFIAGVEKAVVNAKKLGASSTDRLGMAVSTEISGSTDATEEMDGLAMVYSTYAVITKDSDGVITSSYIDMSQGKVNFDMTGTITTDLTVAPLTKQEIGKDYGMLVASKIGKEWFEQSDAFSAYVIGKTAEEISGIAIDAEGHAAEADLISSVTVHVSPFISIISKAIENTSK